MADKFAVLLDMIVDAAASGNGMGFEAWHYGEFKAAIDQAALSDQEATRFVVDVLLPACSTSEGWLISEVASIIDLLDVKGNVVFALMNPL